MTANLMPVRHMYERVILLYKKDTAIVMFGTSILHKSLRNLDNYNITPNFDEKLKHQVHIVRTHVYCTSLGINFFLEFPLYTNSWIMKSFRILDVNRE